VEKSSERLLTAYQEGLLTLTQLRQRMPVLQKQTQAIESELQSLKMAAVDEAKYLQLAESLAGFRSKLRVRAEALDIAVRQQILRLLVKEVLVGVDTLTIRHSIQIPSGPGSNGAPRPTSSSSGAPSASGYLLRSGSPHPTLRRSLSRAAPLIRSAAVAARFHDWGFQPHPDQLQYAPVHHSHP
jgi:site-specific DNA recombinase